MQPLQKSDRHRGSRLDKMAVSAESFCLPTKTQKRISTDKRADPLPKLLRKASPGTPRVTILFIVLLSLFVHHKKEQAVAKFT
ncbi:hypothetical protein ACFC8T_05400 [Enterococcus casseliflavus]|uniref:hypothetical protein n=1 Tax=Enterococcus casseliflavus TaxID=37734 RepID=UPI0039FF6569